MRQDETLARYKPDGYHPVYIGEIFNNRYKVVSKLGFGRTSAVWLAIDIDDSYIEEEAFNYVAVKVNVAKDQNSEWEIQMLNKIRDGNHHHPGYRHVVQLKEDFVHHGPNGAHTCLVYPLMGKNLDWLAHEFPKRQVPANLARQIAEQTPQALDDLHNVCGLVHCDIKPDNILIDLENIGETMRDHLKRYPPPPQGRKAKGLLMRPIDGAKITENARIHVRLADFGWACRTNATWNGGTQALSFRAPEVMLDAPWGSGVDVWSLACVLYLLMQGQCLFEESDLQGMKLETEQDKMAEMVRLLGPCPIALRNQGKSTADFFNKRGMLNHMPRPLQERLLLRLTRRRNASMSDKDLKQFMLFLSAMLRFDPGVSGEPRRLLIHAWLGEEKRNRQ